MTENEIRISPQFWGSANETWHHQGSKQPGRIISRKGAEAQRKAI
jgi:hypothetical protein